MKRLALLLFPALLSAPNLFSQSPGVPTFYKLIQDSNIVFDYPARSPSGKVYVTAFRQFPSEDHIYILDSAGQIISEQLIAIPNTTTIRPGQYYTLRNNEGLATTITSISSGPLTSLVYHHDSTGHLTRAFTISGSTSQFFSFPSAAGGFFVIGVQDTGGTVLAQLDGQDSVLWSSAYRITPSSTEQVYFRLGFQDRQTGDITLAGQLQGISNDLAIIRLDSSGNSIWAKRYHLGSGNWPDYFGLYQLESAGGFVLTYDLPLELLRIDNNGNCLWRKQYSHPQCSYIDLFPNMLYDGHDGNIYVQPVSDCMNSGNGIQTDIFKVEAATGALLANLHNAGIRKGAWPQFGPQYGHYAITGTALALLDNKMQGYCSLDSIVLSTNTWPLPQGSDSPFLLSRSTATLVKQPLPFSNPAGNPGNYQLTPVCDNPLGTTVLFQKPGQFEVVNNPAGEIIKLSYTGTALPEKLAWSLYDMTGRQTGSGFFNGNELQVSSAACTPGLYLLRLHSGTSFYASLKVMVSR